LWTDLHAHKRRSARSGKASPIGEMTANRIKSQYRRIPLTLDTSAPHSWLSIKETSMVRSVCLIAAVLVLSNTARAENQFRPHSSADERACRGDAHRFCRDAIPDQFRVASCLQTHRDRLTHACRSVLESHGM